MRFSGRKDNRVMEKRKLRPPFLIVNPKSYIYGKESLQLAKQVDSLSAEFDIDVIFTAQLVDLEKIVHSTEKLFVTAQHMNGISAGRGMGKILPEGIKNVGADAVVLNHAENPLTIYELDAAMQRAKELGLLTIVCADTVLQSKAIAQLNPDVMICEPTSLIGTGTTSDDEYIIETTRAVKQVNENIFVIQAAGVTTGDDVYRVIKQGADGSGGTSGILNAPSRKEKVIEMMEALTKTKEGK